MFKIEIYSEHLGWIDDPSFLGWGCVENDNRWETKQSALEARRELAADGLSLGNLRVVPADA